MSSHTGVPGDGRRPTLSFGCPGRSLESELELAVMSNIAENGQAFQMVMLKIRTVTIKDDNGVTAKGGSCPGNELLENQIF